MQGSLEAHEEFLRQHEAEVEQESNDVEREEVQEAEEGEQEDQSDVEDQEEVDTEDGEEEQEEDPQLLEAEPLVTMAPSETLGPGPLVTDLEDVDDLETISLSMKSSLCVDDLPDLPELEAPPSFDALQQPLTSNMGVVSCSSDDEDEADSLSRVVPAFAFEREPPFALNPEPKPAHSKASSLVYPEDEDLVQFQTRRIYGRAAEPRRLIEEIDDF